MIKRSDIKKYNFPFQVSPFPKTEEFIRVKDVPKLQELTISEFIEWVSSSENKIVTHWKETGEGSENVLKEWHRIHHHLV